LGQFLETGVSLHPRGDSVQFLSSDPLAVVFAIFPALQQKVRALGEGLIAAFFFIGLLADMAADHAIDAGHLIEDA